MWIALCCPQQHAKTIVGFATRTGVLPGSFAWCQAEHEPRASFYFLFIFRGSLPALKSTVFKIFLEAAPVNSSGEDALFKLQDF